MVKHFGSFYQPSAGFVGDDGVVRSRKESFISNHPNHPTVLPRTLLRRKVIVKRSFTCSICFAFHKIFAGLCIEIDINST